MLLRRTSRVQSPSLTQFSASNDSWTEAGERMVPGVLGSVGTYAVEEAEGTRARKDNKPITASGFACCQPPQSRDAVAT